MADHITGFTPPQSSDATSASLVVTSSTSDSSVPGPFPAFPAMASGGRTEETSSVRSFASTDSVPASQATSYAAFRNSSRNNRAAFMRQGAIADRPRQGAITDRPRRGSAPVVRASEAGPIALGARAGELWEVAEPLPHLGQEAFAPDDDGMDTSEFSGTYVIQQNVAVDIDQTFNQQNNVQFVNVDATTNQFAQVQIGVDPAVALELQHRAAMAEQDARQVRISFDAQPQQAEATHAAVVGNLVQEGRQAVAAAQDEAVHARSQAASSDASLNATLVMARTFEQIRKLTRLWPVVRRNLRALNSASLSWSASLCNPRRTTWSCKV